MNQIYRYFFVVAFLTVAYSAASAKPCDELRAHVDKTYGFKPSKLTSEQITAKSAELDKVWKLVDSDPKSYLPCLRNEISKRRQDTFFRFNASNLLFKHDRSAETKKLMVETYAGADLADINLRYWLPQLAAFGREGLDVSKAGETWLRFPKPIYYLPEHGARPVDKGVGAIAIFGSMDENLSAPALKRLAAEENTDFRGVVLWLLAKLATKDSTAAAKEIGLKLPEPLAARYLRDVSTPKLIEARAGKPKTSREAFIKALNDLLNDKPNEWSRLIAENPDGEKDMVAVFTEADIPLIRRVRRAYAANATPHSPEWYGSFSQVIYTLLSKAETTPNKTTSSQI